MDIRQQKVRLQLFDQLQSVQSVARPADKPEADALPVDQLADCTEQLLLIVCDHNTQKILFAHAAAPFPFS